MAEPQAGAGMELEAIAAVILGGTSISGGAGAIWRSVAGVLLIALIGNAIRDRRTQVRALKGFGEDRR